jgi:hypothetical protein
MRPLLIFLIIILYIIPIILLGIGFWISNFVYQYVSIVWLISAAVLTVISVKNND